jgi:hypothetical protein
MVDAAGDLPAAQADLFALAEDLSFTVRFDFSVTGQDQRESLRPRDERDVARAANDHETPNAGCLIASYRQAPSRRASIPEPDGSE